jgi:Fe-S-cluster containining protein
MQPPPWGDREAPLEGGGVCRRCGTCCRKGGPALHPEDRPLLESGAIPLSLLLTLRRGETARDNLHGGGLVELRHEVIKLRGQGDEWICVAFDIARKGCRIYAQRPLECRTLQCWAPQALAALSSGPHLTRGELLTGRPELLELIATHEARCGWRELRALVSALRAARDRARVLEELAAMLRFDAALREAAVERGLSNALLPFLLGRPLAQLLPATFGLRLCEREGRLVLRDDRPPSAGA